MTCQDTTSSILSPCEILSSAVASVHSAMRGESVVRVRLRDRETQFSDVTLSQRISSLRQMLAAYGANLKGCAAYDSAVMLAGIPQNRAPGTPINQRVTCGCR